MVAVNNSPEKAEMEIPVWQVGVSRFRDVTLKRLILTHRDGYTQEPAVEIAKGGYLDLQLPPLSAVVLYHDDRDDKV